MWGIGNRRAAFLRHYGIHTARQLKDASDHWIKTHLSIATLHTVWELRGVSCLPLEKVPPTKKAIVSSKSFSQGVSEPAQLSEAVTTYASRAAHKLREQGSVAGLVEVFIETNRFSGSEEYYMASASVRLPQATAQTALIASHATRLLVDKLYRPGFVYRKVGVLLTAIEPDTAYQRSLFGPDPAETGRQSPGFGRS